MQMKLMCLVAVASVWVVTIGASNAAASTIWPYQNHVSAGITLQAHYGDRKWGFGLGAEVSVLKGYRDFETPIGWFGGVLGAHWIFAHRELRIYVEGEAVGGPLMSLGAGPYLSLGNEGIGGGVQSTVSFWPVVIIFARPSIAFTGDFEIDLGGMLKAPVYGWNDDGPSPPFW